jgi:hypothetical protein
MSLMKFFELFATLLGIVASFNAGYWFCYFRGSRYPLGKAIAWMTVGEVVFTVVVIGLTTVAVFNEMLTMHPWLDLSLRSLMFLIAIATFAHIATRVIQLVSIMRIRDAHVAAHPVQVANAAARQRSVNEMETLYSGVQDLHDRLERVIGKEEQ